MEGWRQRRLGSKEDHSTTKGNYKTDLTLTGLLMEGLGHQGVLARAVADTKSGPPPWNCRMGNANFLASYVVSNGGRVECVVPFVIKEGRNHVIPLHLTTWSD
jgi:hypothetical protein